MNKNFDDTVVPFNDCFYFSCFYSSLFPVLKYFNKSIFPFMVQGIPKYKQNDKMGNFGLYTEYVFNENVIETMKKTGLQFDTWVTSKGVVQDVIESLIKEKLVIVSVDCYYLSFRSDFYQKEHWRHFLLITSYDSRSGCFNVIDQETTDSDYTWHQLPEKDLEFAYNGFISKFKDDGEVTLTSIGENGRKIKTNEDFESYASQYTTNVKKMILELLEGNQAINHFMDQYSTIMENESELKQNSEVILNGFNDIIKVKKTQKYLLDHLFFHHSELTQSIQRTVENWNFVRIVLAKYHYSGVYKEKSLMKTAKILREIQLEENKFLQLLLGVECEEVIQGFLNKKGEKKC
ncbi:hypothetical protein HNR77_003857 [Paenibacillus sp. JGP012]|uniref:BtrH N-terminal domain-containing protein n=1 Tax=Paenibacillus sp. JGP012 TaxID=2735914 RepID=UPI00161AD5D8|nr:BtrH N-terminal domain-containing protein [Paenibacillus sp. JGP012]MBB6022758.1 hypothetical protein [Paenibacillus sp. JGP012]